MEKYLGLYAGNVGDGGTRDVEASMRRLVTQIQEKLHENNPVGAGDAYVKYDTLYQSIRQSLSDEENKVYLTGQKVYVFGILDQFWNIVQEKILLPVDTKLLKELCQEMIVFYNYSHEILPPDSHLASEHQTTFVSNFVSDIVNAEFLLAEFFKVLPYVRALEGKLALKEVSRSDLESIESHADNLKKLNDAFVSYFNDAYQGSKLQYKMKSRMHDLKSLHDRIRAMLSDISNTTDLEAIEKSKISLERARTRRAEYIEKFNTFRTVFTDGDKELFDKMMVNESLYDNHIASQSNTQEEVVQTLDKITNDVKKMDFENLNLRNRLVEIEDQLTDQTNTFRSDMIASLGVAGSILGKDDTEIVRLTEDVKNVKTVYDYIDKKTELSERYNVIHSRRMKEEVRVAQEKAEVEAERIQRRNLYKTNYTKAWEDSKELLHNLEMYVNAIKADITDPSYVELEKNIRTLDNVIRESYIEKFGTLRDSDLPNFYEAMESDLSNRTRNLRSYQRDTMSIAIEDQLQKLKSLYDEATQESAGPAESPKHTQKAYSISKEAMENIRVRVNEMSEDLKTTQDTVNDDTTGITNDFVNDVIEALQSKEEAYEKARTEKEHALLIMRGARALSVYQDELEIVYQDAIDAIDGNNTKATDAFKDQISLYVNTNKSEMCGDKFYNTVYGINSLDTLRKKIAELTAGSQLYANDAKKTLGNLIRELRPPPASQGSLSGSAAGTQENKTKSLEPPALPERKTRRIQDFPQDFPLLRSVFTATLVPTKLLREHWVPAAKMRYLKIIGNSMDKTNDSKDKQKVAIAKRDAAIALGWVTRVFKTSKLNGFKIPKNSKLNTWRNAIEFFNDEQSNPLLMEELVKLGDGTAEFTLEKTGVATIKNGRLPDTK